MGFGFAEDLMQLIPETWAENYSSVAEAGIYAWKLRLRRVFDRGARNRI